MTPWRWVLVVSHGAAIALGLWLGSGHTVVTPAGSDGKLRTKLADRNRLGDVPPDRLLAATNDWASMLEAASSVRGSGKGGFIDFREFIESHLVKTSSQDGIRLKQVTALWFERDPDAAVAWLDQCDTFSSLAGFVSGAIDVTCAGDPVKFLTKTKTWNNDKRRVMLSELATWCTENPGHVTKVYGALESENEAYIFISSMAMQSGPFPSPDLISILSDFPVKRRSSIEGILLQFALRGSVPATQAALDESALAISRLATGPLRDGMERLLAKSIASSFAARIRGQAATDPAAAISSLRAMNQDGAAASLWIDIKLRNALHPALQSGFNHAMQLAALGESDAGFALVEYFQQVAEAPADLRDDLRKAAFTEAIQVDPERALESALGYLGNGATIRLFPSYLSPDSNIHSHARFVACAAEAGLLPDMEDAIPDTVRNLYRIDRRAASEWVLGLSRAEARRLAVDTLTGVLGKDDLSSEAMLLRGKAGLDK